MTIYLVMVALTRNDICLVNSPFSMFLVQSNLTSRHFAPFHQKKRWYISTYGERSIVPHVWLYLGKNRCHKENCQRRMTQLFMVTLPQFDMEAEPDFWKRRYWL